MSDRTDDLIRTDRPQDPKRWCLIRGTQAVIAGFLLMCIASVRTTAAGRDIQPGLGWVLVALATLLVGGTVVAHWKPDDPQPPGGAQ